MRLSNYKGHKNIDGVFQKIINHIPKHKVYYELFAGSASVHAKMTVWPGKVHLIELDNEVCKLLSLTFPEATVINGNSIKLLKSKYIEPCQDTFIFVDPPYHHSTRPLQTNLYKYELSHSDHVQLLSHLLEMKNKIMVVHPRCELYDSMLSDWIKVDLKIRYNRKTSHECLYMNYELDVLHDTSFVGSDCWERQRIKRKCDRLIQKIEKLPNNEKQYILERIKSKFYIYD